MAMFYTVTSIIQFDCCAVNDIHWKYVKLSLSNRWRYCLDFMLNLKYIFFVITHVMPNIVPSKYSMLLIRRKKKTNEVDVRNIKSKLQYKQSTYNIVSRRVNI